MRTGSAHACAMFCAMLAGAVLLAVTTSCRAEPPRRLTIVSWNVENLFDADDDPGNPGDDEFTKTSWRRWTPERYRVKLERLASVIARMSPDILCLSEIENRRVLDDLNRVLGKRYHKAFAHIVHREGPDHRGIDVAMLARAAPSGVRWLTPVPGQREVIVATFRQGGQPLVVIANHWKSHWGSAAEAERIRATEARAVRAEIDLTLKNEPGTAVIVAGDFNSDFDAPVMRNELRSVDCRACVVSNAPGDALFNLHATLPVAERGTIYYRAGSTWNTFDSISLSRSLLPECAPPEGWRWKAGEYDVVRYPGMQDEDGHPRPYRVVRKSGSRHLEMIEGYADHFPVKLVLERP